MPEPIKIALELFGTHRRIPAGGIVFGTHRFLPSGETVESEVPGDLDFKKLSITQGEDGTLYLELES